MALKILRYWCRSYQANQNSVLKYSNCYVPQKAERNLHCSVILQRKMFYEHENQYAYNIMERKGYAVNFSVKPNTMNECALTTENFEKIVNEECMKMTPTLLFDAFSKLAVYSAENNLSISDKIFDSYIDNLTDSIKLATDEELQSLFYYFLQWPETESIRTRNFIEVWAALDDECLNRYKNWSFDKMLDFISMFYMINVTKASDYCLKCLQKLASKAKQLSPNQLVKTLFYIGIMRTAPFDIHSLELHVDKNFEEFSIDELAIMCMGFFKSKTPIRNMELISKISNKVIEESKDIHEVTLAALLKIIRYSKKASTSSEVYKVLDVLQYEVPRLSTMCNVHLALLGTATLTLHKGCLDKIAILTINSIDKTRVKDLERLVLTYGTFNYKPDTKTCLFEKVVEELRKPERVPEIQKHGRSFACCVSFLASLGIYPQDLMNKVLSPEFLEATYGKYGMTYGREVLSIHNSAKIFLPDVDMHRLSDKNAVLLAKKYTDYVPSESFVKQYNLSEKMVLDILKKLTECRGGEEYVAGDHILTHHQRGDVIVCNNKEGKPIEVKSHFSLAKFGLLHKVPDDNHWVVLVIAGRNAMVDNNTPTGPFLTKITELKKLGYHASLVLWSNYSTLQSKEEKVNYLNSLIEDAINDKTECNVKIV